MREVDGQEGHQINSFRLNEMIWYAHNISVTAADTEYIFSCEYFIYWLVSGGKDIYDKEKNYCLPYVLTQSNYSNIFFKSKWWWLITPWQWFAFTWSTYSFSLHRWGKGPVWILWAKLPTYFLLADDKPKSRVQSLITSRKGSKIVQLQPQMAIFAIVLGYEQGYKRNSGA